MMVLKFLLNILILLDLGLNTLLLGDPSETVSSRLGRALKSGKPKKFAVYFAWLVDLLFFGIIKEAQHTKKHIEDDENFKRELWSWIKC